MRIENRLTVSLLIIFLLLGMVAVFGLVATKKIVSSFEDTGKELHTIVLSAIEIGGFAKRAESHLALYLTLHDEVDKEKFFLRYDSMVEQITYLEKRLRDPAALNILAEIKNQSAQILPVGAELIRLYQEDIKNDGRFVGTRHVDELQKLYTVTSSLREFGNKLVQYYVGVEESKQARAIKEANVLERYIIGVFLAAFVIMVFLAYRLTRSILKPLRKLQAATVEIGAGNLTAEIDISRKDEFGELAAGFKRMAEELHRTMISKDYVSRIIESMIEGMAVVNNNGIIEMVNQALCRMTGYDECELIGRPIISLIEERNEPELPKIFTTESVSESVYNVELSCKTKTGRFLPILFSRAPLFDVDLSVQGVVCIMLDITIRKEAENILAESRDQLERRVEERTSELQKMNAQLLNEISERRQTEDALQQSEAYYRAIVEDQTELICRFSGNGIITFANEACCIYFEKRVDQLLQQKFVSIFPAPEQEKVEKLFRHLSVESPVVDYIAEVDLSSGEKRWHHWTLRLILDRKNEPFEFQAVGRDISEQKDLEQKIQSSAERIKFFAYSVSHDLKNPAINIYALTRILKKNYKDLLDEKGRKFCDQIMQSSEQVTALVDKINQFIVTAEAPLQLEQVQLKQAFKLIVDEFSVQFQLRNIQWKEPETVPDIRMDRLAFIRVMRNMIDNALKYGGEDLSEIAVGYEETDQHHVLSMSNDGTGIPEENYERVFGLFERQQGDGKVEGAGLGLAIVREMTERHKGRAWLGPYRDSGVTFYISILKFL